MMNKQIAVFDLDDLFRRSVDDAVPSNSNTCDFETGLVRAGVSLGVVLALGFLAWPLIAGFSVVDNPDGSEIGGIFAAEAGWLVLLFIIKYCCGSR